MESRLVEFWDEMAPRYDRAAAPLEVTLMRPARRWVCARATGDVLDVACGTGVDLDHLPPQVRVTCLDGSPRMLDLARARAGTRGRDVEFHLGDATALPFADASFDTVVCTFGLCSIDPSAALAEMSRVVRPGGSVLLADHVESTLGPIRRGQRLLERSTVERFDEHFTRRPLRDVRARPELEVVDTSRRAAGVIETVHARRR